MLEELTQAELLAPERLLVVNAESSAAKHVVRVESVREGDTPEGGFDAALWQCEGELLVGLSALRERVRPGGLLVVAVNRREGAFRLVQRIFSRGASDPPSFEALCAAPLLLGLTEPRVLGEGQGGSMISARVPDELDPLDAFFPQPG